MMLTSKQILEKGIVQDFCTEGIQQVGIDLRVDTVEQVMESPCLNLKGEWQALEYKDNSYILQKGKMYHITTVEGVNMPEDCCGWIVGRSTLLRHGCMVQSGIYDNGFYCKQAGCFIYPIAGDIVLHRGTRIGQFVVQQTERCDNLYDGRYQGGKNDK